MVKNKNTKKVKTLDKKNIVGGLILIFFGSYSINLNYTCLLEDFYHQKKYFCKNITK